ncbi:MAG: DNA polymerase I [Lachnospiraceae bacterium]
MSEKLVLIDGNSIINRAFYGLPDLTNAEGFHTNAIYGFLNIMFKILEEEQADYLVVAFDVKAPTFRHALFKEYKGTRKPMPKELCEQVPVLKELLQAMGVKIVEKAGYEADDILGTLAKRAEKEQIGVSLVSGDRDLLQVATEQIKVRIPKTRGGKTEVEDYYTGDVIEKYQVEPLQIIELKALMGDSSDNIPGVPKIGEKTATELIVNYQNIENLREHLSEITKKSIRETLENNFEMAVLSKTLATIDIHADIDCDFKAARLGDLYTKDAYTIMKHLGFKNMLLRFDEKNTVKNDQAVDFKLVDELNAAEEVFSMCEGKPLIGFRIFAEEQVIGVSLCISGTEIYLVPVQGLVTEKYLIGKLSDLLLQKSATVFATFHLKEQLKYLKRAADMQLAGEKIFDAAIAAYLLNPLKNDYEIEDVAGEYANLLIPDRAQSFGKLSLERAFEEKPTEFLNYACFYSYVCFQVYAGLKSRLCETGMQSLFADIEMPLSVCLYQMEAEGILVKPDELKKYGEELAGQIASLEASIHGAAGENFNINSPKQLGEILFDKMQLPGGKKTKTGYSTAADVLEKLAEDSPFVTEILEYRGLSKLKSTYADGLANCIDENNRIHSTFHQTITATGRISSTEPNLQNIPIRMEQGRLIRKVFVPRDGYIFLDADYSQIELRILAHMSGDPKLIAAYNREEDIHRITASEVFHTPFEEVTPLQRRNAKAVNFGIIYGISSFGLSQGLSISRKEAKEYIERYFETYPQVKEFLDGLVADAKKNGYVTTMYGRRRPLPELSSSNFMQRSFGERVAMNAPIQGTAADIIKLAMLHVQERLERENLKSRLILQVHDELLIETAIEEQEQVAKLLIGEMKEAASLAVNLEVDMHAGMTWYDAK